MVGSVAGDEEGGSGAAAVREVRMAAAPGSLEEQEVSAWARAVVAKVAETLEEGAMAKR